MSINPALKQVGKKPNIKSFQNRSQKPGVMTLAFRILETGQIPS